MLYGAIIKDAVMHLTIFYVQDAVKDGHNTCMQE
jgi:hypothetical protein